MRSILLFIFLSIQICALAQGKIAGSWYGKAEAVLSGNHNSYLTELILRQNSNKVEGILGYYFRDGYRSIYVHGSYNVATREFLIKNVPLTYFRATSIEGVDCIMSLYGKLRVSRLQSDLDASLISNDLYKYTCPELKVTFTRDENEDNQDSVINNGITRRLWQPKADDIIIAAADEPSNNSSKVTDSIKYGYTKPRVRGGVIITPGGYGLNALMASFNKRANVLSKEITVESDSLRISFYDNGTIDGDSISVFVNGKPVVTGQALTAEATNLYIQLDSTLEVNEITMYAENLGKYPPNTALMVVNDGENRHEIFLSSSLDKNATVRIYNRKRKK